MKPWVIIVAAAIIAVGIVFGQMWANRYQLVVQEEGALQRYDRWTGRVEIWSGYEWWNPAEVSPPATTGSSPGFIPDSPGRGR